MLGGRNLLSLKTAEYVSNIHMLVLDRKLHFYFKQVLV